MRWHVVERLSPRQALTPDGYLIVTDTIIARCGDQIYHRDEVPLDCDDDGIITVSRDAAEVFRPEAIASFEGKAIVDDHPVEEVTPDNHRDLAVGHVHNVRRGTGRDSDCLVADLVFTDPDVIKKVRSRRKLALSCGYDAHYEGAGRGRGRQVRISGNHVALVDEGRCGARCSIGDSGAAIFSYLAKVHDANCGCDACDRQPAKPAKPATRPAKPARRLVLWVDGVRVWTRRLKTRDYDPNEPRKGKGPGGGEWTSSGGGGGGAGGGKPKAGPSHGVEGLPEGQLPRRLDGMAKRGAFQISAAKRARGSFDGSDSYDVTVTAKPVEGIETINKGRRTEQYNPKYAQTQVLNAEDPTIMRTITNLKPQYDVDLPIKADPSQMYRGMSAGEFESFQKTGKIRSKSGYNLNGQEGLTYWSKEPRQAENYANGFAPAEFKPTFEQPAYIMVAKRADPNSITQVKGVGEDEVGVNRAIDKSEVAEVWRGSVATFSAGDYSIRDLGGGTFEEGGSSAPSAQLVWEKLTPEEAGLDPPPEAGGEVVPGTGTGRAAAQRPRSAVFVSPSKADHLDFPQAVSGLASNRQRLLQQASQEIDEGLGLKSHDMPAVGAWSDGAENSVMSEVEGGTFDQLRVAAAMKAHLAEQKAALVFQQAPEGKALLYSFDAKGNLDEIHKNLLADGVEFHTVIPSEGGATVYVVDTEGTQHDAVIRAAKRHGELPEFQTGHAEFIPAETKSDGSDEEQRAFSQQGYERIIAGSGAQGSAALWQRIHHAHGAKLHAVTDAFDPNEPRNDIGEWTTGGGGGGTSISSGLPYSGGGGGKPSETFKKGEAITTTPLNGKAFESWADAPKTNDEWDMLGSIGKSFDEPPLPTLPPGKHQGAGVIIREPDGRVWIVHPTNQFGGYKATFPKGTVEPGMTLKGTALKEAFEESGLGVRLTGYAGDIERDTSVGRYYYAERVGGTPADAGWESQAVTLAPVSELKNHLNKKVDHDIVDAFFGGKIKAAVTSSAETPASMKAPGAPVDISKWKKTSNNKGSNPGGQYTDEAGVLHYVKLQKSNDHAKNEFLAARLFEAAGSPVLDTQLVDLGGGKLGTHTVWQDKVNIDLNNPNHLKQAQEHFATNAWLANWDAIGMGQHEDDWNQAVVGGKMTTVDPGGSMIFRAQGGPKGNAWGDSVGEWDTMRHGNNPQANKAYGGMTNRQLRDSVLNVVKIPDKAITDLTMKHGPGTLDERQALANRLIKRKRDLMKRAMTTDAIWRRAA